MNEKSQQALWTESLVIHSFSFSFIIVSYPFLSFFVSSLFFSLISSSTFTLHLSFFSVLLSFPLSSPLIMSVPDQVASSSSDGGVVRSGSNSSIQPPPASAGSVQPFIYCKDPSTVTVKKGSLVDFNALWRKLYDIGLSGGTIGDFQSALRLLSQGEGGMDGARVLASMDANDLTSVFRLMGAGVDDESSDVYASLVPGLDLNRKRVKDFRMVLARFINTDLEEEQSSLPLIAPDRRSKDDAKYVHSEGLSILDSTVKRPGKPSRRSPSPISDGDPSDSDPSSSSDDSSDDSDAHDKKKKKKSKKSQHKKKSKARKSKKEKSVAFADDSSPSSDDDGSSSSSSSSSGSDSDGDYDALDSKKIGPQIYDMMKVAGSARLYVRDFDWGSDRNGKEAMALALASDALAKNNPKEAFEILARRLVGVMMADRTGNWSHSSAIEWKNTDGVPLSHKLLKFFGRRAKAFETNTAVSRSSGRRSRQFANNNRGGGNRMVNRNNFSRSNNFQNNNQAPSSNSSSAPRNNNSFRGANTGRSGQSGAATGHPLH